MDQLGAMRIFIAVVESQGFSAASRILGVPVPTVCRKIAHLEDQLGVQLLVRSTRKTTVTDSGHQYYEDVRRILDDINSAERLAAGEYKQVTGLLTITAPTVFARLHILPIVNEFLRQHENVEVRMLFTNHVLDMLDENIDLAIRIGPQSTSKMTSQQAGAMRLVVCASPGYLSAKGRPSLPANIAEHDTITFSKSCSQTPWPFKMPSGGNFEVRVKSKLLLNAAEGAVDSALQDAGITQLYLYQAARHIASGDLEILFQEFEVDPLPVLISTPQGQYTPQKVKTFVEFAKPALQQQLQALDEACSVR